MSSTVVEPSRSVSPSFELTTQQAAALTQMLDFCTGAGPGLMTLEGFAGTGKTTLVAELLKSPDLRRMTVAVAAPTNKAVGVLQDKMRAAGAEAESFSSIHSLLGLRMTERDDGTHSCQQGGLCTLHEYDLVVVDECSMISLDLFQRIVQSRRQAKVLFVGDPAQLPPVDAQGRGEVSPTFTRVTCKSVLTEVVRQAAGNPIIALSMRIRSAIEVGHRMTVSDLQDACPAVDQPTTVGVCPGAEATAFNVALTEIRAGVDARIVAYTNQAVLQYNAQLHEALHGPDALLFSPGERVIVHEACEVRSAEAAKIGMLAAPRVALHTSEELEVVSSEVAEHPFYRDVPTLLLSLLRDGGGLVWAFAAADDSALQARIAAAFDRVRLVKAGGGDTGETVKDAMGKAWALKKAFAPFRHCYAITCHKSQGSTIDTVIVDLNNLGKMRDTFEHGRALYVAATRAARHLALVA